MFTAYIDESGSHDQSPEIGVGGVIADAVKWKDFERDWRTILETAGVPYSHMKEFAHSSGAFKKWKSQTKQYEPERKAFLEGLCDCIVKNVAYTFGAIITRKHYETIVPERLRRDIGSPYTFLGRYCIARVGVWAQDNSPNEPVDLIFERGQPATSLRSQHRLLSANAQGRREYRLGLLTFADKHIQDRPEESLLPLQAADVVAYELVKHWTTLKEEAQKRVQPYAKRDLRRYPLKRLMELAHDWNKLTVIDIGKQVMVWQTVRDYAKALNAEISSE